MEHRGRLPWRDVEARRVAVAEVPDVGFEEAHAVLACLAGLAVGYALANRDRGDEPEIITDVALPAGYEL